MRSRRLSLSSTAASRRTRSSSCRCGAKKGGVAELRRQRLRMPRLLQLPQLPGESSAMVPARESYATYRSTSTSALAANEYSEAFHDGTLVARRRAVQSLHCSTRGVDFVNTRTSATSRTAQCLAKRRLSAYGVSMPSLQVISSDASERPKQADSQLGVEQCWVACDAAARGGLTSQAFAVARLRRGSLATRTPRRLAPTQAP